MKKILMALALVATFGVSQADAMGKTPTYEVGYSTFSIQSVICTTGTAVNITASPYYPTDESGPWAGLQIQNQDSADTAWFGDKDANAAAGSGFKLAPGSDWTINIGKGKDDISNTVRLYCEADSAAGAAGLQLLVIWFGY